MSTIATSPAAGVRPGSTVRDRPRGHGRGRSGALHPVPAVAGLALVVAGLALPWTRWGVDGERTAWQLPAATAWWTPPPVLSWLAVLLVATVTVTAVGIRRRGPAAGTVVAAAAVVAVLTLAFPVVVVTSDAGLLAQLHRAQAAQGTIYGQFGYRVYHPGLVNLAWVPLRGDAQLVVSSLRGGWWCCLTGALVLLVAAAPAVRGPGRDAAAVRLLGVTAAVTLAGVAAVCGRGAWARHEVSRGVEHAAVGDYRDALADYEQAFALQPALRGDVETFTGYGRTLDDLGFRDRPAALVSQAAAHAAVGDLPGAVQLAVSAHRADPGSQVVDDVLRSVVLAASAQGQPPDRQVLAFLHEPGLDGVDVAYTEGRVAALAGDCATAEQRLRQVTTMTGDTDVVSSAWTYIAICRRSADDVLGARAALSTALAADPGYFNTTARTIAAGMYPVRPPR